MKFGQLLEYSMGNIFREKSYPKYGEETIPWPFSKKSKDRFLLAHIKLVLKITGTSLHASFSTWFLK